MNPYSRPSPPANRVTYPAKMGLEAALFLQRSGQPRNIQNPAVGRGLARRSERPLRLPLPSAAATARPHFQTRLYLAHHLPDPFTRRPSPSARPPSGDWRTVALQAPRLPSPGLRTCPALGGRPAPLTVLESERRPGTWPQRQIKLFPFAGATGRTRSSPSDHHPDQRRQRGGLQTPSFAHLLLPDSAARGESRIPAARERGAQAVGLAGTPSTAWRGRRYLRPFSSGPPQGQCLERVQVPAAAAAAEAPVGLGQEKQKVRA